jgi:hypothetical protein
MLGEEGERSENHRDPNAYAPGTENEVGSLPVFTVPVDYPGPNGQRDLIGGDESGDPGYCQDQHHQYQGIDHGYSVMANAPEGVALGAYRVK